MNELRPGEINKLEVERISDIAYMLTNGEEIVFLHFAESLEELKVGDFVDVFLYYDNKKRLTATTLKPFIVKNEPGFVKVIDVNENLGVFVDNNIDKDLLISLDHLPYDKELWPKVGDELYCELKVKKERLVGKIVSKDNIENTFFDKEPLIEGDKVMATPIRIGDNGTNFMTKEGHSIFVYLKHQRTQAKIGEEVEVTITKEMGNGSYYGTVIGNIPTMMGIDADTLINYMKENDGVMEYTSKTDPEVILNVFKMSKGAFKRAIGNLYKRRLIEILDDKIILKVEE